MVFRLVAPFKMNKDGKIFSLRLRLVSQMFRHIFRFYSSFAPATILVTLACAYIYRQWGNDTLFALIFFKLLTNSFVWFITRSVSEKKLYYYYNLHLSKVKLWTISFGFDLLLLILLISNIESLNIST